VTLVGRDDKGKDWGGSEVHDWGVSPPADSGLRFERPVAAGDADDRQPDDDATAAPVSPTDEVIASAVLIAMENRRHTSSVAESDDAGLFEYCLGAGDSGVYAIDDGKDHTMIGRGVGRDDDGCIYCLVARITRDRFEELGAGDAHLEYAFDDARDISLTSVFQADDVSNVVLVQRFKRIGDVPGEYRPPSPFLRFTDA
jgi:hypothetical protein